MSRQSVDRASLKLFGLTVQPPHCIAAIGYPEGVDQRASGMTDDALNEHVVAHVTAALAHARKANLALVAVTGVGMLRVHIQEDPRTAQVVARALSRIDADLAFIMDEPNDCARVVMDCGVRVAMVSPRCAERS